MIADLNTSHYRCERGIPVRFGGPPARNFICSILPGGIVGFLSGICTGQLGKFPPARRLYLSAGQPRAAPRREPVGAGPPLVYARRSPSLTHCIFMSAPPAALFHFRPFWGCVRFSPARRRPSSPGADMEMGNAPAPPRLLPRPAEEGPPSFPAFVPVHGE